MGLSYSTVTPQLLSFTLEKIQYALNIFIVDLHLLGNNSNIDDRNNYCYYSWLCYSYEILQWISQTFKARDWTKPVSNYFFAVLETSREAEVWHTSDRDVTLCPLCAFHFHVFWLYFNIMKLKEAPYNFEICIYCII